MKKPQAERIIYDFGANNGDDISYYLKKSDVVVAIEANPVLTKIIEKKYGDAINSGKIFIENCVLNAQRYASHCQPWYWI